MSTEWDYTCLDHDGVICDVSLNRGDDTLARWWDVREALALLVASEAWRTGELEVDTFLRGSGDGIMHTAVWLAEHKDCRIMLRSEYGDLRDPAEVLAGITPPTRTEAVTAWLAARSWIHEDGHPDYRVFDPDAITDKATDELYEALHKARRNPMT